MRFLKLYLVGYFVLLFGAAWALWQSGILDEIPGVWIAIGAVIAGGSARWRRSCCKRLP